MVASVRKISTRDLFFGTTTTEITVPTAIAKVGNFPLDVTTKIPWYIFAAWRRDLSRNGFRFQLISHFIYWRSSQPLVKRSREPCIHWSTWCSIQRILKIKTKLLILIRTVLIEGSLRFITVTIEVNLSFSSFVNRVTRTLLITTVEHLLTPITTLESRERDGFDSERRTISKTRFSEKPFSPQLFLDIFNRFRQSRCLHPSIQAHV